LIQIKDMHRPGIGDRQRQPIAAYRADKTGDRSDT
jgi:hypothetical protein